VRHCFASDPRVLSLSFSEFVAQGGMALHRPCAPKLIRRSQLRQMFFSELEQRHWTFLDIKQLCQPWLFAADSIAITEDEEDRIGGGEARSLVKPEELILLFNEEIACRDLCDLLDLYWKWPLSDHLARLIHDDELACKLLDLQRRHEAANRFHTNTCRSVMHHFFEEKRRAPDTLVAAQLESDRDRQLQAIDGRLKEEQAALNNEWIASRAHRLVSFVPHPLPLSGMEGEEHGQPSPSAPPLDLLEGGSQQAQQDCW